MAISDFLGLIGVGFVLLAYFLLQAGRLEAQDLRYPLINLAGASLILISLFRTFNLASFVIEIVWIAISLYGIARILIRRRGGA
ncbi:MAG: hypothetical protein V2I43_12045 [Parvularcula sp.]|jgi:hypothetical protein|nr:hypothetical protein [Parvularcula sp.]